MIGGLGFVLSCCLVLSDLSLRGFGLFACVLGLVTYDGWLFDLFLEVFRVDSLGWSFI